VLIVKKSNREILTLTFDQRLRRASAQLRRLTGEKLDSENIVPLVQTGVRSKTAGRIAQQRKTAEKNSAPVSQWPSSFGGRTYTVGELLESDSGRKHIDQQIERAESRAETDQRRASLLRAELQRVLIAENKQLRAELSRRR
jgi:hypothetical protein